MRGYISSPKKNEDVKECVFGNSILTLNDSGVNVMAVVFVVVMIGAGSKE